MMPPANHPQDPPTRRRDRMRRVVRGVTTGTLVAAVLGTIGVSTLVGTAQADSGTGGSAVTSSGTTSSGTSSSGSATATTSSGTTTSTSSDFAGATSPTTAADSGSSDTGSGGS